MPLAEPDSVTGLILAGGQAGRRGGADRGLVEFRGRPLVLHAIERLAPQVAGLMISASRNLERYRSFVPRVFCDAPATLAGPLAGIEAGLTHAPTPWVAVVPCDVPRLPLTLVARLSDAVNARGVAAACARVDGRLQPAFCLLSVVLLASLHRHLETGGRAVHAWLAAAGAVAVDFDDGAAFRKLNLSAALTASGL
jgi:molybdopterin-guanine dinucleotide biosynthesis protein A